MNAQIGKDENNKYCLHNLSNRNGEHLTKFSLENRIICLNTKFQKRKGKIWTYTHANNAKAQIDYILINKKWINRRSIFRSHDCHSKDTFEPTQKYDTNSQTTHYNWSSLNNRDISNKYTTTLENKFDSLQEISETLTSSTPTWKQQQQHAD